jgi:hypothetical protein
MFHISLNEACRLISLQVYAKYKDQITPRDVIRVSVVFCSADYYFRASDTTNTKRRKTFATNENKSSTQQIIIISAAPLKFGIKCRYYGSL